MELKTEIKGTIELNQIPKDILLNLLENIYQNIKLIKGEEEWKQQ